MLSAVIEAFDRLIDRVDLAVRALLRGRQSRRVERLYGNLAAQPLAPRQGRVGQITNIAKIVTTHCANSSDVVATHGAAAIKIDATEYAFSMMLEELRSVMSSPPTAWRPTRAPAPPSLVPVADTAARAA